MARAEGASPAPVDSAIPDGTPAIRPHHGEEFPPAPPSTPPVPESRGRETGASGEPGGRSSQSHPGLPAPSLAGRNAPRADEHRKRRKARTRQLRSRMEVSAMPVVLEPAVSHGPPRPGPPTPPPQARPRSRRVAVVRRNGRPRQLRSRSWRSRRWSAGDPDGQDLSPRPRIRAPGPGETRSWGEALGGGGVDHHNLTPDYQRPLPAEKNAPRADGNGEPRKRRARGSGAGGRGLGDARRDGRSRRPGTSYPRPLHPRPSSGRRESRPGNGMAGGGRADHHDLPPDYLRPPSPEKALPGAGDDGSADRTAPAVPEPEEGLGDAWR